MVAEATPRTLTDPYRGRPSGDPYNPRMPNSDEETRNRQILERIPTGRWGRPEDIAGTAVFLASEASDYVTGQVLAVDGGWLAR